MWKKLWKMRRTLWNWEKYRVTGCYIKSYVTTFLGETALFLTKKRGTAGDACSRDGDML